MGPSSGRGSGLRTREIDFSPGDSYHACLSGEGMLRSRVAWSSMTGMRLFRVAMVVIAVAAAVVLDTFQKPASDAFSTSAVRL